MVDQLSRVLQQRLYPDGALLPTHPLSQDEGPWEEKGTCCEWAASSPNCPSSEQAHGSSGGRRLSLPSVSVAHPGSQGTALFCTPGPSTQTWLWASSRTPHAGLS